MSAPGGRTGIGPIRKPRPAWIEGTVNRKADHISLSYGEGRNAVALVAPHAREGFTVQFLLRETPSDTRTSRILSEVRRELTFYLLNSVGPDAWHFARYHCETPANFRSIVRWTWHPRAT